MSHMTRDRLFLSIHEKESEVPLNFVVGCKGGALNQFKCLASTQAEQKSIAPTCRKPNLRPYFYMVCKVFH